MMLYNGKFGGGGKTISPLSLINDGFIELSFYDGVVSTKTSLGLFEGAENGGL